MQHTYPKVPYKPEDLQPVGMISTYAWVFTVNPQAIPVNNWKEFVDYARANPGKINFASSGIGTSPQSSNADEFAARIREDTAMWKTIVDRVQVRITE